MPDNRDIIPDELRESLSRFVEHGIPCGGFLTAVLENDLREACARADMTNRYFIWNIVAYCWNYIPGGCWGSPEKVNDWIKRKRMERESGTGIGNG